MSNKFNLDNVMDCRTQGQSKGSPLESQNGHDTEVLERDSEYKGDQLLDKRKNVIRIGFININGIPRENEDPKNNNNFIVFADPLDGSSNIDVNVSIGTIFSIMNKNNLALEKAFIQKGSNQKASGFFVYGPQTTLFISVGHGTALFALDELKNQFYLIKEKIIIPKSTSEFAINAAYKRFWNAVTSIYIKDCQDGEEGSRKKNFGMRWVGSLVADASRIFIRGGIFLYPADNRKNYKDGRLRLTYEANPIAFLIEQAGGKATNGYENILNLEVKDIHQRSPLIFGSLDEVLIYKKHYEII